MTAEGPPAAPLVVAGALAGPARLGAARLVAVDGPAGSGKTTLAAAVADGLRAAGATVSVVHLDDLYEGWSGLEGSLWPRLEAQVLAPVARGEDGLFVRWDWTAGRFADRVRVPAPDVLVVEGCGSGRRAADAHATLLVWVEAADDLRLARGLERDGQDARGHWERWMRDEAAHFARERTRARAHVHVDADGRVVPGPLADPAHPGRPGTAG
ncbi:uridine kinase family protein [Cellulomonas endophytica]|uniref:uridine kinase family protein n=1 Tax=Cellulomonas endophytica TaxID=2494735 RepID=UPI00196AB577|nr:ATP/GTP-binding protein [Cellulomonas endophytica]